MILLRLGQERDDPPHSAQGPGRSVPYMRAFGYGPRHFEPWSSVVDVNRAGTLSPNYHTTQTGGRLSSRQI
ncbi:hypothetical protein TNCV_3390741 [Trichonephila clavipes]|nr:hypothetical protein TNCV_3390741 [Trichonephila clavipes]